MDNTGKFVISLDFELLWGVFDVVDLQKTAQYFLNTRKIIPNILRTFETFHVNATWATVGMLHNKNWEEWMLNKPEKIPQYSNTKLSSYLYGESIKNKKTEIFCFAPEIIQKINETPGQELATHTYSHYYCQEPGPDKNDFISDLLLAVKVSKNSNTYLSSLVFPRNQINTEYLTVCKEAGINNVRSNPSSWYWKNTQSDTLSTKIARTGDAYLSLGVKSYSSHTVVKHSNGLIEQMASRFLRPVEENSFLRKMKLRRIFSEMTFAAKNNEIYHLWWHPHNFGNKPEESIQDLTLILAHFRDLKNRFGFQSYHMRHMGESLLNNS